MNKNISIAGIIVILVFVGVVWYKSTPRNTLNVPVDLSTLTGDNSAVVPSSETVKVSDKLSSYQNAELGFGVKYPTSWEKDETNTGATFVMPIDTTQVSTVAKLQASIGYAPGKCVFPPATTITDRGTLNVGDNTFNMISITSNVQGRGYFNRMYSLQKGNVCYVFTFSTITLSPDAKNLTGSNITQAQNNNKAVINTADATFTDMVKSFAFLSSPAGVDESTVPPVK